MTTIKETLRTDLTAAIKARDELRSSTLRMLLAAIRNVEVAGKIPRELSDDDVTGVLATEAKKRREAVEAYSEGGRPELAAKEQAEAGIIAGYLPEPLTAEQISDLVSSAIDELGIRGDGMKAMGRVMGMLAPQTRGRADGGTVSAEVRRQLSGE